MHNLARLFLIGVLCTFACLAQEETKDLSDVPQRVAALAAKYGAENVLVVWDVDNTIAETIGDLGSEVWFLWQMSLLDDPATRFPGVKSYEDVILLQRALSDFVKMKPVQPELPEIIKKVQASGVPNMLLTSRNPALYPPTKKELDRLGIDFGNGRGLPGGPFDYHPYGFLKLSNIKRWGLPAQPRTVRFQEGMLMTQGQHKGAMLRSFLKRARLKPKAILFIDDTIKHVLNVEEGFGGTAVEIVGLHYTRTEERVKAAFEADKAPMAAEMERLKPALLETMKRLRACSAKLATFIPD
jgi:hypothetical protein